MKPETRAKWASLKPDSWSWLLGFACGTTFVGASNAIIDRLTS